MTNSRQIFLTLLKVALGWCESCSIPENVNWNEIVSIAEEQGVLPIIIDGYEKYLIDNPQCTSFLSKKQNEELKVRVLSSVYSYENTYIQHLGALSVLSAILDGKGIPFIVMKGLSCGRYYPIPKHRPCGDIDIFAGTNYTSSNKALEENGISVIPHYYRHSVSTIYGVTIENHRILSDLRGPQKQTKELEELLVKLGEQSLVDGESYDKELSAAHYPTADFNAIFLPWHVSAHFEFERVTIRHLLDWALFLKTDGRKINLEMYREAKRKFSFGYGPFADILTDLSIRYLGLSKQSLPIEIIEDAEHVDKELADKVFERIFDVTEPASDTNVWRERWKLFKYIWKDGWKYKGLYGMSPIRFLFYKIYGVVFKVGEE